MQFGKSKTKAQAILYDIAESGRGVYKIVAETRVEINGGDSNYKIATNITEAMIKKLRHAKLIP